MSQNDFTIANASGASVRADMNSAFQALASASAGATAPSTTFQYQYWFDTTLNIQKQRDGANTAWVSLWSLVGSTLKLYEQGTLLLDRPNTWTAAQIVERLYSAGAADPGADKIDALGIGTNLAATQAEMETATAVDKVVTPGRQHNHPGSAKVWVDFNGTGVVAINDSYNVTSITDNGVGDYTVNFSTDFATTSYAAFASHNNGTNSLVAMKTKAVGSTRFETWQWNSGSGTNSAKADPTSANFSAFGDQ